MNECDTASATGQRKDVTNQACKLSVCEYVCQVLKSLLADVDQAQPCALRCSSRCKCYSIEAHCLPWPSITAGSSSSPSRHVAGTGAERLAPCGRWKRTPQDRCSMQQVLKPCIKITCAHRLSSVFSTHRAELRCKACF